MISDGKLGPRTDIPEEVKRQVRQNDGFGCCKCGNPIIQYHHIVPRSEDPKDIMLLCPLHHDEATSKAMTLDEQLYFKANPLNVKNKAVNGILKINHRYPVITIGSVDVIGECSFFVVTNESLLSLNIENTGGYDNSDRLTISLKLYDKDDHLLVDIQNNEWLSGNPKPWDIIAKWQYLKISRKLRDVSIEIDTRDDSIILKGELWRRGQHVRLGDGISIIDGIINESHIMDLCLVGTSVVIDTESGLGYLCIDSVIGHGVIISGNNRTKRIRDGLAAWRKLKKTKDGLTGIEDCVVASIPLKSHMVYRGVTSK
jgi:hypothetical protein